MATKKTTKKVTVKKQEDFIELPEMVCGNCVDYGMIPRDYLVKHHISSAQYAMKQMKKQQMKKDNPPE